MELRGKKIQKNCRENSGAGRPRGASLLRTNLGTDAAGNSGRYIRGQLERPTFRDDTKRLAGGIINGSARAAMPHVRFDLLSKLLAQFVIYIVRQLGQHVLATKHSRLSFPSWKPGLLAASDGHAAAVILEPAPQSWISAVSSVVNCWRSRSITAIRYFAGSFKASCSTLCFSSA